MAPKSTKTRPPSSDPHGMFAGMVVFLIESGVQTRRLQIWKQKLVQMGATTEDRLTKRVTHIFAGNSDSLLRRVDSERLARFKGKVLPYQWLEDSLRLGEKVSVDSYKLKAESEGKNISDKSVEENHPEPAKGNNSSVDEASRRKKFRSSPEDSNAEIRDDPTNNALLEAPDTARGFEDSSHTLSPEITRPNTPNAPNKTDGALLSSLPYSPPDLNRNITEIFGKLINIYRALGEDRRSFSYYKAIGVIEKLPFKIESAEQVKDLPTIGKSMQDHIQEIVTTGKLSKLEHFETDEKVRAISLFGEVWGIGPATALKLYEKGHLYTG
ncbi:hypothetical protein L1049_006704 [Liquidambar formosana]|uniref:BRCT domain-containing protein n=1 Tax=Liquidambar formosana TaxID=63359 RepID=A0AAP0WUI7_LIQFO